ncbi:MAG: Mrp/NBP35 family ATP-binding protein [Candidatus Latescibacterota bacterium]|nr:MAG: Mrp/NBP35 family ATP-binding protein [Candidatus Latescibacterota bacterium]
MLSKDAITNLLKAVKDVGGSGDIVTNDRIQDVEIENGKVKLTLFLATRDRDEKYRIEDACFDILNNLEGVEDVQVVTTGPQVVPGSKESQPAQPPKGESPLDYRAPIPGVKNIIAVASGKGGVGKSTICVNLALALRERGARVGLLDADIYGPSLHILLGVHDQPKPGIKKEIAPVLHSGLKLMSLGFLTNVDTPVIWRGPMVAGVVKKFLQDVEWGDLDYLMIDLPPGTGDAQLTLVQTVPITGAIIVTTPSEIALVDAEKGLKMFEHVDAPVLGIIENMSTFVCPHCGDKTDIFASDGGKRISAKTSAALLGQIPLDPEVRAGGDKGRPTLRSDIDSPISKAFLEVADKIMERFPVEAR